MSIRENPVTALSQAFAHWEDLYANGGCDPFYPDGVNLNLVRNHILYYKREIENQMPLAALYLEEYARPTPPEVASSYMANPDEIRHGATSALAVYTANEHCQFLREQRGLLSPAARKATCIDAVLGYAESLARAIADDDLVTMRRAQRTDIYLSSFADCAEKVRALLVGQPLPTEEEDLEAAL